MSERAWKFGDVVRIDPEKNSLLPQPDDRRWMVVSFGDRLRWTLLYLGPWEWTASAPALISHWPNTIGFIRVEDDDEEDEHRPYIGEFD